MAASRDRTVSARRRRLAAVASIGALMAVMTWGAAPASATIVERDRFTQPYEFVNWDCGYPLTIAGVESHLVQFRVDKKDDRIVYVTDNYEFKETWTAPDGRWFTLAANGLSKDVRAKSIGGSAYQLTFHTAGQWALLTDSSGNLVSRNRGNLSFSYTFDFDTENGEFLGFRVAGPHPLFFTDLCKFVAPLVGSDSGSRLVRHPLGTTDSPMGYEEYLPSSYMDSGSASPLLVVFNGYGENGDGSAEMLENLNFTGIPRFIDIGGWPTDRPLVVLASQHIEEPPGFSSDCGDIVWFGSCNMQVQHDRDHASPTFCTTPDEVHDFITYAVSAYNVDPKRVYATGLSCGGFGTWEYLAKYGDVLVAAAGPIAGVGRPAWDTAGCGLGSVAIWAFHGELDDVVNPLGSIETMTNLAGCPGVPANRAMLTVYPDLDHQGWDQAYSGSRGEDIYSWMLGFSKP
jgi:predicted esterase